MKYRIEYRSGNGYSCGCCSSWADESEEIDNYEGAVDYVASILNQDWRYASYNTTIAIAENPHDFIEDGNGEFELNFDLNKFESEAKQRAILFREQAEINKKKLEEKRLEDEKKALEERERSEYERLRLKYENKP